MGWKAYRGPLSEEVLVFSYEVPLFADYPAEAHAFSQVYDDLAFRGPHHPALHLHGGALVEHDGALHGPVLLKHLIPNGAVQEELDPPLREVDHFKAVLADHDGRPVVHGINDPEYSRAVSPLNFSCFISYPSRFFLPGC